MIYKARNIVAVSLMMLILFSSIGFNIISTFCDGCAVEQTSISITSVNTDLDCNCCSFNKEHASCCAANNTHTKEHHQTKSTLAQLRFDSPEAKSKSFHIEAPLFLLHFVSILFNFEAPVLLKATTLNNDLAPPLFNSGREILSLICILRN